MALSELPLAGWPFDLRATLNSGQVFHWHECGQGFTGLTGDRALYLEQPEPGVLLCLPGTEAAVVQALGLDHPMAEIVEGFPAGDVHLHAAIAWCPGLRIMRQPRWECLATFITSSLKQVPHIRKISLMLRERFGRRVEAVSGPPQFAYPTPAALASAGVEALRACGLGYRAAFLHRCAEDISCGRFDLDAVAQMPDAAALESLMTLHGVGEKIASCALLFGWERHAAFPVDVWVQRIIQRLYFPRVRKLTPERVRKFIPRHFGPRGGYAQQFLFHWARTGPAFAQSR